MREGTIIQEVNRLWKGLHSVAEGMKVSIISQTVRDQALENLLIAKGLITKDELEAEVKKEATKLIEESKQMQAPPTIMTPNPESKIVAPTQEEVQAIIPPPGV